MAGDQGDTGVGQTASSSQSPYMSGSLAGDTGVALEGLKTAKVDDVTEVAAALQQLLSAYHREAISQGNLSFNWALRVAIAGVLVLFSVIVFVIFDISSQITIVAGIGGAIVEVVAGTMFALYHQARKQMADYKASLDEMQHYTLAYSIASNVDGDKNSDVLENLAYKIAGIRVEN